MERNSGGSGELRLMIEDQPDVVDPSWPDVRHALSRIKSGERSFVILDNKAGFVQALGRPTGLVVERRISDVLYALGRSGEEHAGIKFVPGSVGCAVPVWRHEVLDLADAIVIFRAFYFGEGIPPGYGGRNITNDNDAHEIAQLFLGD